MTNSKVTITITGDYEEMSGLLNPMWDWGNMLSIVPTQTIGNITITGNSITHADIDVIEEATDYCYQERIVDNESDDVSPRATNPKFTGKAFDYTMHPYGVDVEQYSIRDDVEEEEFIRLAREHGFLKNGRVYWITTRQINKLGHRRIIGIHVHRPAHYTDWTL